jgi:hypothetical protein
LDGDFEFFDSVMEHILVLQERGIGTDGKFNFLWQYGDRFQILMAAL